MDMGGDIEEAMVDDNGNGDENGDGEDEEEEDPNEYVHVYEKFYYIVLYLLAT